MEPRSLSSRAEVEAALAAPLFLVFKHSPICPTSARAFEQYRAFLAGDPAVESGWIDVLAGRELSRLVAERTGVRHESPQALLIEEGRPRWTASHGAIVVGALRRALQAGASDAKR
jgi:bacillithiol system protein YtxJ